MTIGDGDGTLSSVLCVMMDDSDVKEMAMVMSFVIKSSSSSSNRDRVEGGAPTLFLAIISLC